MVSVLLKCINFKPCTLNATINNAVCNHWYDTFCCLWPFNESVLDAAWYVPHIYDILYGKTVFMLNLWVLILIDFFETLTKLICFWAAALDLRRKPFIFFGWKTIFIFTFLSFFQASISLGTVWTKKWRSVCGVHNLLPSPLNREKITIGHRK